MAKKKQQPPKKKKVAKNLSVMEQQKPKRGKLSSLASAVDVRPVDERNPEVRRTKKRQRVKKSVSELEKELAAARRLERKSAPKKKQPPKRKPKPKPKPKPAPRKRKKRKPLDI